MLTKLTETRLAKPWGRNDVSPAFGPVRDDELLGEIWFQRDGGENDALLVKYLFTSERLSIQVHPDDGTARAAGHDRGKDEAWLVLDADPSAEIGIGLEEGLSAEELRSAALAGSIVDRLDWRSVKRGDAYYSPAGTLHSIGAGLTLLEIQQNCDVTYRLYDFGRPRELHLDLGVSAAKPELDVARSVELELGGGRSLVVNGPKFSVERWRASPAVPLPASNESPIWLIPTKGQVRANGQQLDLPSVWIAEEAVALVLDHDSEILVAYEGSEPRELN